MNNQPNTMQYDLAANFDPALITEMVKIDTKHQIKSVFGKLHKDMVGGGRASMVLPGVSFKALGNYIDLCHKNDLKFNYLINPACLGNREINPRFHKKLIRYIDRLCRIGIDAITVNSPYLCELIRNQFPHLMITIGVAAGIINCKHIQYWEELGADELTLGHGVNRNFRLLEEILTFTRNRRVSTRVIANNVCLHECPYKFNHSTGQSHASQKGYLSSDLYIDYNLLSCNRKKIEKPEHLIASEWIRPEDIHYYEELCSRTGNQRFSVKLLDRTKTTAFLLRVVRAYIAQSYDGNLIDILNWPSKKDTKVIHKFRIYWQALFNRYNIDELVKFEDAFNLPAVYIDNKKLDGFIEKFYTNADRYDKICGKRKTPLFLMRSSASIVSTGQ